jgi:hypothetical protein
MNNDFAAMGLGGPSADVPKANDEGANNDMGFDFGDAADPGTGSGNDIFGNFGGVMNPPAAQSQPEGNSTLNQFDSYVDPFSDPVDNSTGGN